MVCPNAASVQLKQEVGFHLISVLVGACHLEAEQDTRTWAQVVYLECNPRSRDD